MNCDIVICSDLYANILSGGTTIFSGLLKRIETEIFGLEPVMETNVVAHPDRKCAAWIGGSYLALSHQFNQMILTHDEYNDVEPSIAHHESL